jgi:formylglycine-generating enzyme required for sulfatase activity
LLKCKALLDSTGGETTVYYDYVENGRLKGGRTTIILPPLPDKGFMEVATLWNVTTFVDNGPTSNRIDIVFVGDGYTAVEMVDYANHTDNILSLFMAEEPIAAYSTYFNIHRVDVISNESGVDEPDLGIYRDTALDMTYNCSGIERLLCVDVSKAILAAGNAPDVDHTLALANSTRYGGAGYPGSYLATLAGDNSSSVELALHEFGHSFANLADEYDYDDGSTYTGPEPTIPNVSIYTAQEQLNLQTKWYRWLNESNVDTYEGAYYEQYGIYRPTYNSKMRSLNQPFEQINVERFIIEIYKIVSPIDDATPSSAMPLPCDTTFFVTPLQPADHNLDIQWSLNGQDVLGATDPNYTPDVSLLPVGIHDVAVRVVDNTSRVRDENAIANYLTASRQWQIEKFFTPDLDGNEFVGINDFYLFIQHWMETDCNDNNNWCDGADMDHINGVNMEDFALFAQYWLTGDSNFPDEMVYIPGGEFEMGDHLGDTDPCDSDELPVHAVLVDAFFMSKFEITNQQYCDYLNSAYPAQLKVVSGVVYASTDTGNSYPYCDTHSYDADSQIDFSDPDFSVRTKDGRDMSDDPMVEVSWYGAVAYCNWRSGEEGKESCYNLSTWVCDFTKKGYRLATEAEWEYAARGGEHSPYYRFPWGDTISHSQANYYGAPGSYTYDVSPTSGYHPLWDGVYSYTSPVGFFDGTMKYKADYNWPGSDTSYQTNSGANGYGLYDMAGNVWEWCNDWYDSNYYNVSPYDNPEGPASGTYRVLRGGCWDNVANYCRVANRNSISIPDYRFNNRGFRIVLDLN